MQRPWCISKLGHPPWTSRKVSVAQVTSARARWTAEELRGVSGPQIFQNLGGHCKAFGFALSGKGCSQHFDRRETLFNCVKKQQGHKCWFQSRSFGSVRMRLIGPETRGQRRAWCKGCNLKVFWRGIQQDIWQIVCGTVREGGLWTGEREGARNGPAELSHFSSCVCQGLRSNTKQGITAHQTQRGAQNWPVPFISQIWKVQPREVTLSLRGLYVSPPLGECGQ